MVCSVRIMVSLAILIMVVAGCAAPASTPGAGPVDLTGTWEGNFRGAYVGTIVLTLQQSGASVTGTAVVSGSAAGPGGELSGTVSGDSLTAKAGRYDFALQLNGGQLLGTMTSNYRHDVALARR